MIRPFTILSAGLALVAVGYLFHVKNQTLLLDRKIERIARDTMRVNAETAALHVEWTALNDPDRLRELATKHLTLKPTAPTQFSALTDVATRLPAPRAFEPEPEPEPTVTIAAAPTPVMETPATEAEETLPIPPMPVPPPRPAQLAQPSPTTTQGATTQGATTQGVSLVANQATPNPGIARPAEPARPPAQIQTASRVVEDTRLAAVRPPLQGPIRQEPIAAPRPQTPPPLAVVTRPVQAQHGAPIGAPIGGSMLGGAQRQGDAAPLPRPVPLRGAVFDGGN